MLDILFNLIGTIGVILILIAYFLVQVGKIEASQVPFSLINLVGAVCLLISLIWKPNLPAIMIEICWIIISLYSLFMVYRKRKVEE